MKNFKKLFLSTTTIMLTSGAVDPAQAFIPFNSQNEALSALQQGSSKPTLKSMIIPAINAQIFQRLRPSHPVLQTSHQQQTPNQLFKLEKQNTFSFFLRNLASTFTVQSQDGNNNKEKSKLGTQLTKFFQAIKATRQSPKNIAFFQKQTDNKRQALMQEIKAPKKEIKYSQAPKKIAPLPAEADNKHQILIQEIKALKEEIKQLQAPKKIAPLPAEADNKHQALMQEIIVLKDKINHLQAKPLEAQVIAEPQVAMPAFPENSVILPREEFERLNTQISTLTTQVEQLQYSQLDLIDSVSTLSPRGSLPAVLHSSALRPINTPTDDKETSSSTISVEKATAITDSFTNKEDSSQQPVLSGVMTALPSDVETSTSSAKLPLTHENSLAVLSETPWNKEEFEQTVLGIKPTNLSAMSESERDLWRTFTVLKFTNQNNQSLLTSLGSTASTTEHAEKPWTTWGGAFSTMELEEKFKSNNFMQGAFKDIVALHLRVDVPIFFQDYAQYFILTPPNLNLDPEKDADLTKAYYFRGLYRALTGENWTGKTYTSNAAGFQIDLETGLKGSRFNYGSDNLQKPLYETSIYEAEEYFKDTPWHGLFINKVQQATLEALTGKNKMIVNSYNQKMSEVMDKDQEDLIENLTKEKDLALSITKVMTGGVNRATSLRDIDDALDLL
ncbi:hypothetical protein IM40_01315 [Candidatus Paracaedimonas acanthamoebae]|nr:hypothetical protein IM40_01315 [Candidatus Paracaedimonas acanthamoebae]